MAGRPTFSKVAILLIGVMLLGIPLPAPFTKAGSIWHEGSAEFANGTMNNVSISSEGLSLCISKLEQPNNWICMTPAITPPARGREGIVYDDKNDQIIMFGGNGGHGWLNDTWIYNFEANNWTNMNPPTAPSPRQSFGMVYDSKHCEVILFGGEGGRPFGDTWTYNLSTNMWTNMNPTNAPYNRSSHSMVYDKINGEVILFGGWGYSTRDYLDTWTYNLTTNGWKNMNPPITPPGGLCQDMAFDDTLNKVVLFGGYVLPWGIINDTWIYDLATNIWTNQSPKITPPSRGVAGMIYDSVNGEMIIFGGWNGTDFESEYFNDTWTYNSITNIWTNESPANAPSSRSSHNMAFDNKHQKLILFGGGMNTSYYNDTWIYTPKISQFFGNYTANPYDTGGTTYFNTLSWDADILPNTSLDFQFRSADTEENLTKQNFLGPDGQINSFYTTSSHLINPINNGTRWFQYRAYFVTNDIMISPILYNVTISYNLLHSLKIISPAGGEIWNGVRIISWKTIDLDNDKLLFDISLLNSTGGMITLATNLTDQSWQWNISKITAGSYKIQIIARDDNPSIPLTASAISAVFMIDRLPSVDLISPINNSIINNTSIRLQWHGSDPDGDLLIYTIRYSDRPFSAGKILTEITSDDYLDLTELVDNATYFWTVNASDGKTILTDIPTDIWNFTVKLPSPTNHLPRVTLNSPANNSYVTTRSVRIQWKGSDPDNDPLNYTVRYSDQPFSQGNILINETTAESLDLFNLVDNKTYFWTIDAFDRKAFGMDTPTDIWSFTVRLPPANIPVRFTSTPNTTAWVGQEYAYNLTSLDEDGDIPIYSIVSAPATMTLDPKTGKLLWTPTISDIGNHTITIRVADGRGSFDTQTFTIEVKQIPSPPVFPPKCSITHPANGSKLHGAIQIEGTAVNGSFPLSVIKIRIDNGSWFIAVGLESWKYHIDTSKLAKGNHRVEAKAFAANLSSETASADFTVDNPSTSVSTGGNLWCAPAALIIIVTGIALLIILKRRTK